MKVQLAKEALTQLRSLKALAGTDLTGDGYQYVQLQANHRITAHTYNVTTAIEATLPGTVEEEGSALYPRRFLEAIPTDDNGILTGSATSLVLQVGHNQTTLNPLQGQDLPFPKLDDLTPLGSLSGRLFRMFVQQAAQVALDDPSATPAYRSTIWIITAQGQLTIAACDQFQLTLREIPLLESGRDARLLVSRDLARVARLIQEHDTVELSHTASSLIVRTPTLTAAVQLRTDGQLPPYDKIVPPVNEAYRSTAPVGELLRALRTVKPFNNIVQLTTQPLGHGQLFGLIALDTKSPSEGSGHAEIATTTPAQETKIAFNARLLDTLLGNQESDSEALLQIIRPDMPLRIDYRVKDNAGFSSLPGYDILMPMQV